MKIYFDKTKLSKEALKILKENKSVYSISYALIKHLDNCDSYNIHDILCFANYEMACAKMTDFEEDIIDFGTSTLEWLNKALLLEPENEEIKKDIKTIQKKLRKLKNQHILY